MNWHRIESISWRRATTQKYYPVSIIWKKDTYRTRIKIYKNGIRGGCKILYEV